MKAGRAVSRFPPWRRWQSQAFRSQGSTIFPSSPPSSAPCTRNVGRKSTEARGRKGYIDRTRLRAAAWHIAVEQVSSIRIVGVSWPRVSVQSDLGFGVEKSKISMVWNGLRVSKREDRRLLDVHADYWDAGGVETWAGCAAWYGNKP